jgi:hypothetical protein
MQMGIIQVHPPGEAILYKLLNQGIRLASIAQNCGTLTAFWVLQFWHFPKAKRVLGITFLALSEGKTRFGYHNFDHFRRLNPFWVPAKIE